MTEMIERLGIALSDKKRRDEDIKDSEILLGNNEEVSKNRYLPGEH